VETEAIQIQPKKKKRKPKPGDPLTHTEKLVLHRVVNGYSNREIATNLFISVRTVEGHIEHCLIKMEAKNRTQAAVKFYKDEEQEETKENPNHFQRYHQIPRPQI
jgi:DNA-binding NarL/FixJ family response regulator